MIDMDVSYTDLFKVTYSFFLFLADIMLKNCYKLPIAQYYFINLSVSFLQLLTPSPPSGCNKTRFRVQSCDI